MADEQPEMVMNTTKAEQKMAKKEKKREEKREKKRVKAEKKTSLITARDIVDWLLLQKKAPHPMETSAQVMMMWFEAMGVGLHIWRHLDEVMKLWREEADERRVWALWQQDEDLAEHGPDMTRPKLTMSWQQFQHARQQAAMLEALAAEAGVPWIAARSSMPMAPGATAANTSTSPSIDVSSDGLDYIRLTLGP